MELLSQVLISGVTLGSLYALVGLGFVVIYRATKVVNFAQGEMMMLGAMLALYFYSDLQFPYFLAFLLAIVLSGVFGAGLERFAYRPLLNAPVLTLILATVAVGHVELGERGAVVHNLSDGTFLVRQGVNLDIPAVLRPAEVRALDAGDGLAI